MIDINKESEEYVSSKFNVNPDTIFTFERLHRETFIAGHNSKATQAKVLQGQIDVLLKYQQKLGGYEPISGYLKQDIQIDIYELQQKLKQLEKL